MKPDLSYESLTRFMTSFGVLLMVGGISLFVYMFTTTITSIVLTIYSMMFIISGGFLVIISMPRLENLEKAEIRYKQEKTIREILEQDYLLAKVKLAYEDLNKKISSNKKGGFETPRGMESIVKQAFDTEFYKKTYGLGKKKKGFWRRIFKI